MASIGVEHIFIVRHCVRHQEYNGEQDTVLDLKSLHRLGRQTNKQALTTQGDPCFDKGRLGNMAVWGEGCEH